MLHLGGTAWDIEDGDEVSFGSVPIGRGLEIHNLAVCVKASETQVLVIQPKGYEGPPVHELPAGTEVIARPGIGWIDTINDPFVLLPK